MGLEVPGFRGQEKQDIAQSVISEMTSELKNIDVRGPGIYTELEKRLSELSVKIEATLHSALGHAISTENMKNSATPEEIKEFADLLEKKAEQYKKISENLRKL